MTDISPINSEPILPAQKYSPTRIESDNQSDQPDRPKTNGAIQRGMDRIELSNLARFQNRLREVSGVRHDVVDEIRTQINEGTYEISDTMLNTTINRLTSDLI